MLQKVMTVCGPIQPEKLGFTSMHEHILSDCSMFRGRVRKANFIPNCFRGKTEGKLTLENRSAVRHDITLSADNMMLDDEIMMTGEVAEFKIGGGDSIVEVSAPGIRSSPEDLIAIQRISQNTGVHIVVSTGLYAEDTWPEYYRSMTVGQYVNFLQQEITQGIGDTKIYPGHIKAAYEKYTQPVDRYLEAAAFASRDTKLSLQIHLGTDVTAVEIKQYVLPALYRGGCISERTILCHVQFQMGSFSIAQLVKNPGRVPFDISLHRELLSEGFVLCFTPFGFEGDNEIFGIAHYPDWYTLSGIVALIQEGYVDQIVLGNDVFTKLATRRGGGDGYRRLTDFIVPAMKECGITDQEIYKIMIGNPARILAF